MAKDTKWTKELRSLLYERLLQEFGPYTARDRKLYPPQQKAQYEVALRELANFVSSLSGESFTAMAVKQQVRWGITHQSAIKNQGHARQWIPNKVAALEEGFLGSADLPSMLALTSHCQSTKP
jgi:hypothetical protein